MCLRHARQAQRRLDKGFEGDVLDLLDERTAHLGRALASEARLARRALRAARIKQLEIELRFVRAQFDALSATAAAHKTTKLSDRLWQLQHRIDHLEAALARLGLAQPPVGLHREGRPIVTQRTS